MARAQDFDPAKAAMEEVEELHIKLQAEKEGAAARATPEATIAPQATPTPAMASDRAPRDRLSQPQQMGSFHFLDLNAEGAEDFRSLGEDRVWPALTLDQDDSVAKEVVPFPSWSLLHFTALKRLTDYGSE
jgi:hypothetical protein